MMNLNGAAHPAEHFMEAQAMSSPFAAAELGAQTLSAETEFPTSISSSFESPFMEAMNEQHENTLEALGMEALLGELEDEEFDEAVQGLIDEAAARHLSSTATWSSESEAPAIAAHETQEWIGSVAAEADRLFERLQSSYAERPLDTFDFAEFQLEGERLMAELAPQGLVTEQFFKKLIKKAGKLVKGAVNLAKKGVAAVAKLLPVGKLFDALRNLIKPLLMKVLKAATNRLPAPLRPVAQKLADKVLGREAELLVEGPTLTEAFDAQLAEAILAPNEAAMNELVAEAANESSPMLEHDPTGELDNARARLTRQLEASTPGVSPIAEMEQFIPIVMAALPIIRIGMGIIGRDKIVKYLASRLADLIKAHIGPAAAQALAGPIVDVGMKMLSLEAESPTAGAGLGMEAIVATVEDTVRTVGELSLEALSDPVRLEAETHEAFVEAAGRHIPRRFLSPRLRAIETADGRGVWIYMPRATRPCYRYKKFTQVFRVPVTQPAARAIRFPAGDTLEQRLLDAGARVWPLEAEVHLYETLPGTQLGHIAAFESEAGVGEVGETALEFEEFTPEIAAMLVQEPGLGRRARTGGARRLFRISAKGLRVRRISRFSLRLDLAALPPAMRIHLRLAERESHAVAVALGKQSHAQVVAQLRNVLGAAFRSALAARLTQRLAEKAGQPVPAARSVELADQLAESMLTVVSQKLPGAATALAQAARDAARGVTLTFAFGFPDRAALISGAPRSPTLNIRPGWHRD
jgi:hypothetical protein